MKNRNGFTLMEILAVIVIISILVLVATTGITKYMTLSRQTYNEKLKEEFLLIGKNFYSENKSRIPTSTSTAINDIITAQELASRKYLSKELKDSENNSCMEESYIVVRYDEKNKNQPQYTACMKCGNNTSLTSQEDKPKCNKQILTRPITCTPKVISKLTSSKLNTEIIPLVNNNNIYFTIKKSNQPYDILTTATINLKSKTKQYETSTIKYKLLKLINNNYVEQKNEILSINNQVKILNNERQTREQEQYKLEFTANDKQLKLDKDNIDIDLNINNSIQYNYSFNNKAQEFEVLNDGKYKIELWGAAGNYYPDTMKEYVGKGAYTAGEIELKKGTKLYIYTGKNSSDEGSFSSESFNAGSTSEGKKQYKDGGYHNSSSGGGATDVRLKNGAWNDQESLKTRIMVAAGGGGTQYFNNNKTTNQQIVQGIGGAGGGLIGYSGYQQIVKTYSNDIWKIKETDGSISTTTLNTPFSYVRGATQTTGGITNLCHPNGCKQENQGQNGKLGVAGNGSVSEAGGGGGGGYYGGAGGGLVFPIERADSGICHSSGSGGSSYISGHQGSISLTEKTNPNCKEKGTNPSNYIGPSDKSCSYYSDKYFFTNTIMIDGENYVWTNKRQNTSINKANTGSGKAVITALTPDTTLSYTKQGQKNCTQ